MLRGCWSWTRYGDTSFGGVLGTGVPLNSPMVAPPQRRNIPVAHAGILPLCSRVQRAVIASTQVSRDDAGGGAMDSLSRTLPNYFGFHESAGIRLHPRIHVVVLYLHSVARGGGKPFASPSPGKSSHCTHALLFRTTMTAFPRNGHVLYKDLPTPYQLSGNNSWGSFLQSKTVWDRKIEARLCFTWSVGQKHSSAAQAQETRDASILMMLGPCTHATAPRAPASCQGSTFELVDKSDAYENIAQMVRACFSRGNCLRFPSVGEMVRDSR